MKRDFEILAERVLILANEETGERKQFKIQIGLPYWTEQDAEAACPVVIEGLLDKRQDIRGIDPLDAIEMSLKFIQAFLTDRPWPEKVCWSTGDPYFDQE